MFFENILTAKLWAILMRHPVFSSQYLPNVYGVTVAVQRQYFDAGEI